MFRTSILVAAVGSALFVPPALAGRACDLVAENGGSKVALGWAMMIAQEYRKAGIPEERGRSDVICIDRHSTAIGLELERQCRWNATDEQFAETLSAETDKWCPH
jgi:hypothetical protein